MYILTKVNIDKNAKSSISIGSSYKDSSFSVFYPDEGHLITDATFDDFKVGCMVALITGRDFMRTSPIKSFEVSGDSVTFETTTSTYTLIKELQ